jgi:hypothetical protein
MSASSTLIMDRFLAHLLAFMAAILSKGIASGNDEDLNNITWFSQYFLNIIFTFSVWIVLKSDKKFVHESVHVCVQKQPIRTLVWN